MIVSSASSDPTFEYTRLAAIDELNWCVASDAEVRLGVELHNAALARALRTRRRFTPSEFAAFGIMCLVDGHFIRVGRLCYRPANVPFTATTHRELRAFKELEQRRSEDRVHRQYYPE